MPDDIMLRSRFVIVAEGRIIHLEPAVAFGEVDALRQADRELLAKARVTFAIQQV